MSKRFRGVILLAILVVAVIYSYPTIKWYFLLTDGEKALVNSSISEVQTRNRERTEDTVDTLVNLVRDDNNAPLPKEYKFLQPETKKRLKDADITPTSPLLITDVFTAFSRGALLVEVENYYASLEVKNRSIVNRIIRLGLDIYGGISVILNAEKESLVDRLGREPTADEIDIAMSGVTNALVNRIDSFGVTEPQVRRLGKEQLLLEIPGEDNKERVDTYVLGRGRLTFNLVDNNASSQFDAQFHQINGLPADVVGAPGQLIEHPRVELDKNNRPSNQTLNDSLRAGLGIYGIYEKDSYDLDKLTGYLALEKEAILDGNHIKEAQVSYDQLTAEWRVNFRLDSEGGDLFYNFTKDHKGSSMAVIIDNKIRSVATIMDALRTNVSVSGLSQQEASDLALLLQTAALPVSLDIVNLQTVGPALGKDTIEIGLNAILLGFILVVVFMLVWYKGSGLIASIGLLINLFLVLSLLSVMNFTLTLTSIASLILTVGMAVDANVIIFERIKEELVLGKARSIAVDIGFRKAFATILDANITTFIAALFLSVLGQGSIQGFAVVLTVGIVCTIFSALFISRLLFDVGTDVFHRRQVSISWKTPRS